MIGSPFDGDTAVPAIPSAPVPDTPAAPAGAASLKSSPATRYDDLFARAEQEHGLPPGILKAVSSAESNFNPAAVSPKQARGIMQMIDSTAARFGVKDAHDPEQAIPGAAKYLRFLLDRYDNDLPLALAGYNAGEGAVDKRLASGGKLPAETRAYVPKVLANFSATPAPQAAPQLPPQIGWNAAGQVYINGKTFDTKSNDRDVVHAIFTGEHLKPGSAPLPAGFNPWTPDDANTYAMRRMPASDYGKSFAQGVEGLKGMGGALGSAFGRATGIDALEQWGKEVNTNSTQYAGEMGSYNRLPQSYKDVNAGNFGSYAGHTIVNNLPQIGALLAGGAAGAALRLGASAGMGAAGYGVAAGDIAQNQIEASGHTDPASTFALAVPYAAIDLLSGTGGAIRRGIMGAATKEAAGTAGRFATAKVVGMGALRGAAEEPLGEVAQEVINTMGRQAVNPAVDLMSPEAQERYKESLYGSIAPGALFGGAMAPLEARRPAVAPSVQPELAPLPTQVETMPGEVGQGMPQVTPPSGTGRPAPGFLRPTTTTDPGTTVPFDLNALDGGQVMEQAATNPQFQQLFERYKAAEIAGDKAGMAQARQQAALLAAQQMQASPGQGELFGKPTIPADYVAAAQAPATAPRVGRPPRTQVVQDTGPLQQVETKTEQPAPAGATPAAPPTSIAGVELFTKRGAERKDAIRKLVRVVKDRLINDSRLTKEEWDAGTDAAVKDIPPRYRGAVVKALRDDHTYQNLATAEEAGSKLPAIRDKVKANVENLSPKDIAVLADSISQANEPGKDYVPYGPLADLHALIQSRDSAVAQFSRANNTKPMGKWAEQVRDTSSQIANAMHALATDYGEQNIDKAVRMLKERQPTGLNQDSGDVRFSQAWKMFKTGELAGNEFMSGMRSTPTRHTREEMAIDKEVAKRETERTGEPVEQNTKLNEIMGNGTKQQRALNVLKFFQKHSAFPLVKVVASSLSDFIRKSPNLVPDIVVSMERDPKGTANGRYVPAENKVYLFISGQNERTLLHELIHALSMSYLTTHWKNPTPALRKFISVFDEFTKVHESAFEAYKETLDADERRSLTTAVRATAGMARENKFAAVSEFLTYGLTQLQFQEYLNNLKVDEGKFTRNPTAGSRTEVLKVTDKKGAVVFNKSGTAKVRTTLTVWAKFTAALSHILTGKSWAGRENTIMSHFIESSAEMMEQAAAETTRASGAAISKLLKGVAVDDAPSVAEESESTVSPELQAMHDAAKAAREKAAEATRKEREAQSTTPPALIAERFKSAADYMHQASIIKPWEKKAATPLSMLDGIYKAVLTATGIPKLLRTGWEAAEALSDYAASRSKSYRGLLHTLVDRYGQSPEYINASHILDNRNIAKIEKLNDFVKALGDLPPDKYAAITAVLNSTEPLSSIQDQFTPKQLEAIKAAQSVMQDLVKQAVDSGVISEDQAKANGYMVFKKMYLKELQELNGRTGLKQVTGIAGLSLQQTGIVDRAPKSHVTLSSDDRYIEIIHVRANGTTETYFVPPGTPLSAVNDGENVAYVPGKPVWTLQNKLSTENTLGFHRPYTDAEMKHAGAIDDPRYLIQITAHHLMQDIAHADMFHYLRDLGEQNIQGEENHPEHKVVFDTMQDAQLFEKEMGDAIPVRNWTEVPRTKNDSGGYRFGALAGKVIPTGIWNDINARVMNKPIFPEWSKWLTRWKKTKTTWSPVTHFNNIASNFALLYYNDISSRAFSQAFSTYWDFRFGTDAQKAAAKSVLDEFNRSGANIGAFDVREVRRDLLKDLVEQMLGADRDQPTSKIGEYAKLLHMTQAWEKVKAAGKFGDKAYQMEDNAFRLAAYIQGIQDGLSSVDAGKFASQAFVDYHITAPGINLARQTVLPFLAWPYRMIPAMLKMAVFKPWKVATLLTVVHGLNALGYAIAGGDEDEERKFLPRAKKGNLGGVLPDTPKTIRLPWDTNGKPNYYDISVLLPIGDLMGMGNATVFGASVPAPLVPGGPLVMLAEALFGYDTFGGKKITEETNSMTENVAATAKYLAQGSLPNLPLPGTRQGGQVYDLLREKHGITGAETNTLYALLNMVGPKFVELDKDEGAAQLGIQLRHIKTAYREAIAKAARGEMRYATPDNEKLMKRIAELTERMQKEMENAQNP